MEAGKAFDRFARVFAEDKLCAEALFWAGESYRMAHDNHKAYEHYNRCRWDHPASEAAKYARGRLALPEMLSQFEADSRSVQSPDN
jgi:TolA-binding protein